ncbi:MAG TPA: MurR/RpiR family transcriptional regulator [Clostridiaceae bacterium]|nr:MurR/RpiR family transcriptional regulator [Clostridiaceae bacterium]
MYGSFFQRIKEKSSELKGKQFILAEYLMANYKRAAFMNSSCLAKNAKVSEATVNRFANTLGYTGFTQMINELRTSVQSELTTLDRVQEKIGAKSQNILEKIIQEEHKKLLDLPNYIKQEEIDKFIQDIYTAKKIFVLGFQISCSLAWYFGYMLGKVTGKVQVISQLTADTHSLINITDNETLIIAFAYPRYPNALLNLCESFARRGAVIVSVTDSLLSPVIKYSKQTFQIPVNCISTVDQLGPVLVFIQAVVLEYNSKFEENAKDNLASFEEYTETHKIFYKI